MRRSLLLLAVVGVVASCGGPAPSEQLASPSPSPSSSSSPVATRPSPGVPVRLRIPSIGVDSPVMVVGLMPDGSVGTPCDPLKPSAPCNTNASAWYRGSVRPGEPGSAVLDGHVDWYGPPGATHSVPAVFAHLDRLRPGQRVDVVDDRGRTRSFFVDRVVTLAYPKQPADTYSREGPPSITLITCAGAYVDRRTGGSKRVYVHAVEGGLA